jgi:hypothetical protein
MCDTMVVVTPEAVWLAKNSDREPGEAQAVEHVARGRHPAGARLRTTYLELDQVRETHELVISRPAWMWGAEMGMNEHGLAIGNEAVFTRVPVSSTGLLGMDLLRLALERCKTADEAVDLVTWMIARHGQGGAAGHRNKGFRYHNAFFFADPSGAWLLETAGPYWAAARVAGARTTSNVLTIGREAERVGPGTIEAARALGRLPRGADLDFREAFADPAMAYLSGGDARRACTLAGARRGAPTVASLATTLRDHGGRAPERGVRMTTPCAHASWLPTRGAGQTTGTMVSRLARGGSTSWLTGTSAPCVSVLKPVPLGLGPIDTGPLPRAEGFDRASLFWRSERLHRATLRDYDARRATFEPERAALEARALELPAAAGAEAASALWEAHREAVVGWAERAATVPPSRRARPFDLFWRVQSLRDGVPPIRA